MPSSLAGIPIRWKLPLLVCGLSLVMAFAILWAAYREVRRSTTRVVEERLAGALTTITGRLNEPFRQALSRLHELGGNPSVAQYIRTPISDDTLRVQQALGTIRAGTGSTLWLDFLDHGGAPRPFSTGERPGFPMLEIRELLDLVSGPDSVGVGAIRAVGDTLVYPLVVQVADRGTLVGFVVIWQRLAVGAAETGLIAELVGPETRLYLGSVAGGWADQTGVVPAPPIDPERTGVLQGYAATDGRASLAVMSQIGDFPWFLVLEVPESGVLAPVRRFLARMSVASLVIAGAGLLAGLALSRQIVRPLDALTKAAEEMRGGAHQIRVPTLGRGEIGRLAEAFNQMAERVDAEVTSRTAAEAQWRLLFAENPHPMWVYDCQTRAFLAVNDAAITTYGYSRDEFAAMRVTQIEAPDQATELQEQAAADSPAGAASARHRHRRKDGTALDVEVRERELRFDGRAARLVLAENITTRLALEAALRQSQKMDAVGRLAGGIAHDFNNFLAVIMTYAELAGEGLPADDSRVRDLSEVTAAAEKAHALTRQLLAFSRQQVLQPTVLDPNSVLSATEQMLRRVLGEDIVIEVRLEPGVGRIRIDPNQLEQVILNLALNARDAMPGGGTLTLTTTSAELDEESRVLHGLPEAGRFVVIAVSDTGVGISPEIRARIFEPFFTTKEVGKGTGLGLATLYAIVTQAGGNVTVYSEPDMGSTFRVYLPRIAGEEPAQPETRTPDLVPKGNETILLVEDDAAVRAAATAALERLGYTVLSAQGAADAMAWMERRHTPVDLVISDVVMPGADGPTLIRNLRRSRGELKAILMSGYTGEAIASRGSIEPGMTYLEKPFTVGTLARKVRAVLDAGATQSGA